MNVEGTDKYTVTSTITIETVASANDGVYECGSTENKALMDAIVLDVYGNYYSILCTIFLLFFIIMSYCLLIGKTANCEIFKLVPRQQYLSDITVSDKEVKSATEATLTCDVTNITTDDVVFAWTDSNGGTVEAEEDGTSITDDRKKRSVGEGGFESMIAVTVTADSIYTCTVTVGKVSVATEVNLKVFGK